MQERTKENSETVSTTKAKRVHLHQCHGWQPVRAPVALPTVKNLCCACSPFAGFEWNSSGHCRGFRVSQHQASSVCHHIETRSKFNNRGNSSRVALEEL